MLAVNAAIDGEDEEVLRLVKEFDLNRSELGQRLLKREGEKYDLTPRKGAPAKRAPRAARTTSDLEVTINGRTSVRQLFRIIEQADRIRAMAQQEIKRRPDKEVEAVKKAVSEIELLRRERRKIEQKIQDAEQALW